MKPRIAITLGCPSGIGAEITAAALSKRAVKNALTPIVFGDASLAATWRQGTFRSVSALKSADRRAGKPSLNGGAAQFVYLQSAIGFLKRGQADGLCTAPVSKEMINRAGLHFVGHTEVLAEAFGVEVMMLMAGPRLRVALATNHLPIIKVPKALSTKKLLAQLQMLNVEMRAFTGARKPRIAVCGLNPHAGDGGVLGTEDLRIIKPAVEQARARGIDCEGPLPADGLFASAAKGFRYDVALAMFHDQGLVATKTLDFEATVNVTLGLPIPRTSPDHGTAYDIAGKGLADEMPMVNALLTVADLASRQKTKAKSKT